ncbi:hypothetical protein [Dysgonomonas macrotermitis]|uniref:hypothetical protein n=1 Tax=Dysgonomonas macrotermitis TaxID=1346286 RepID=UPI0009320D42|nr:hypothetical protein [Dysgonomonas macrotermitis]
MRNGKNILKQNSLPSGIIIKLGLWVAGFALCAWVVVHLSINTSIVLGCILAYMGICLVFKVVKFVLKVIFSLLSFILITALILLLIF